jgi:hypothetical protein
MGDVDDPAGDRQRADGERRDEEQDAHGEDPLER